MRHLRKKIILSCFALMLPLMFASSAAASPVSQFAQGNPGCARGLLTLPVWYRGLTKSDGNCELDIGDNPNFIWVIALNIVEMFMHVVGYVSGIFVLIGGYRYMTSTGEPDKISGAKKTISSAITGLIIALFSVAIINFIIGQVT